MIECGQKIWLSLVISRGCKEILLLYFSTLTKACFGWWQVQCKAQALAPHQVGILRWMGCGQFLIQLQLYFPELQNASLTRLGSGITDASTTVPLWIFLAGRILLLVYCKFCYRVFIWYDMTVLWRPHLDNTFLHLKLISYLVLSAVGSDCWSGWYGTPICYCCTFPRDIIAIMLMEIRPDKIFDKLNLDWH